MENSDFVPIRCEFDVNGEKERPQEKNRKLGFSPSTQEEWSPGSNFSDAYLQGNANRTLSTIGTLVSQSVWFSLTQTLRAPLSCTTKCVPGGEGEMQEV